MASNSYDFDKLLKEFDSEIDKKELGTILDKIVNSADFTNNINYEYQDTKIRKNENILIFELKKEVLLPKHASEIDYTYLLKMINKNNLWFNSGLTEKMKVDIFYYSTRLIFVVLATGICKTILKIDHGYKDLIIEKLNKTHCTMGGDCGLHDGNLLGEMASLVTKFESKIKSQTTINVLNEYIELYNMFKKSDLNKGADIDALLFETLKNLFGKVTEKNILGLNKLVGLDENYLLDIVNRKDGIHIFTIFEHITAKLSEIKDTAMNDIVLLDCFEFIYNIDPNKIVFYAEKRL